MRSLLADGRQRFYGDPRDLLAAKMGSLLVDTVLLRPMTWDWYLTYVLSRPVFSQLESLIVAGSAAAGGFSAARPANEVLGQYFVSWLWPFFLAFGLAVRITRVTADVSGWPV